MNVSVVSVIPWQQAKDSEFVLSIYMRELAGGAAAKIITCLILWVAFASVFSATLGYSRIPYAAQQTELFLKYLQGCTQLNTSLTFLCYF